MRVARARWRGWSCGRLMYMHIFKLRKKKIEKSMFLLFVEKKNLDFAAVRLLFLLDYRSEFLPLSPCWRGEPGKAF